MKWKTTGQNITDPVFNDVVIETNAYTVGTMYVDFVSTFSSVSLEQDNRSALYVGGDNMLYYHNKDMSVNACRAYFQLANALVVNGADGLTFGGFGSDPARVPRK